MKQSDAVEHVMDQNGGYATLAYLYRNVNVTDWKTKTPFASIRRIVQDPNRFFKIRPGLWALNSRKKEVLRFLNIENAKDKKSNEEFNHTYYQGLLVEIGNMKGFDTFVPNQDKNRIYLNKQLKEITTLGEIFQFTYEKVLRRARTVDVTWFNKREFPASFFEIEFSTHFESALLKYLMLQDFNVDFKIVADKAQAREYFDKLSNSSFDPIRKRINFIEFGELSIYHSKISEFILAEKRLKL